MSVPASTRIGASRMSALQRGRLRRDERVDTVQTWGVAATGTLPISGDTFFRVLRLEDAEG
jgi:hypothetical protein